MKPTLTLLFLILCLSGWAQKKPVMRKNNHFYFVSWMTGNNSFGNTTIGLPIVPNNLDLKIWLKSAKVDTTKLVIMSFIEITENQMNTFFIKKPHIIKIENNIIYAHP